MSRTGGLLLALTILWQWQCSDADSLADEPPVEVVIQGEPTWENGIGELVRLKCGYCHAVPKPAIAPDVIVDDMDLNSYETAVVDGTVVRGGDSIGRWIYEGILDQPVLKFDDTSDPRQMPLDYGTQLTEREKLYLENWSNAGSPRDGSGQPPLGEPINGSRLYFEGSCQECHSFGSGFEIEEGLFLGPEFRPEAVTVEKIRSMWLYHVAPEPLAIQAASDIRAFILQLITKRQ